MPFFKANFFALCRHSRRDSCTRHSLALASMIFAEGKNQNPYTISMRKRDSSGYAVVLEAAKKGLAIIVMHDEL